MSSQNTTTSCRRSHTDSIASEAALRSAPPMIHGVRRPSGPKVWSEPTAIQAFMKKLSTMPSAMVRARPATRPSPTSWSMRCGMSTTSSAAIGAANSSEPSAKPAVRRLTCNVFGLLPSGAVIGSRRSRKEDSRFGTAASRCAAAVSGEPPSARRAACTSGRSLEASGTRGRCCTARRFRAALASGVSVFS